MKRRPYAHRRGMWLDWTLVAVAGALAIIAGLMSPDRSKPTGGESAAPYSSDR